jgi:hypothetical protein
VAFEDETYKLNLTNYDHKYENYSVAAVARRQTETKNK